MTSDVLLQLRPEEDFDREAMSLGARIYVLPRFTGRNLAEYKEACREFFREHHDFAAVEGHMTSMASVYLPIAKAAGVPVTIAHARSAGVDAGLRGLATRLFRSSLSKKCDIMMSCSKEASISVFGRKAYESGKIMKVPNALDVTAFRFNPEARRGFRARYGIPEDAFVIGHVGRFDPVKNQKFLAEVGRELMEMTSHSACGMKEKRSQESERQELQSQKKDNINQSLQSIDDKDKAGQPPEPSKIRFFFAGKGGEQEEVQKAFDAAGLHDAVIFAGQLPREETCAAYQAFDLFAFPSLYEGLPGTVIEAQAAGLPCVIADTITDEVALTDLVVQLPLDDPGRWAEEIRKNMPGLAAKAEAEAEEKRADSPAETTAGREHAAKAAETTSSADAAATSEAARAAASEAARQKLDAAGYDIVTAAAKMQEFYLSLQASR